MFVDIADTTVPNLIADFDVCNKTKPMNITIKGKIQQS
jgi:hypothetical protein